MSAPDHRTRIAATATRAPLDDDAPGPDDIGFLSIVEGIIEGVAVLDPDWRFVYVNEAGARNLGGRREELTGKSVFDHYPWLRGTPIHRQFARCLETGQPARFEAPFPGEDGQPRWFEFSVQMTPAGVLVLSLDVTARHTAAAADAQLRAIFDSIDLVAIILDPSGRLQFANEALFQTTGWAREEVVGRDWFTCFVPDDIRGGLRALFDRVVVDADVPRKQEHALVTRDGRRRTVVWSNTLLKDPSGRVTAVASVGDDVTDRVAAETARSDSEQRLREIVGGVEAIVAFQEREGTGVLVSPQIERILGWRPDQVPDFETWHDLVHPDDIARCMEIWDVEPPTWQLEYRMRRADGSWAWVVDRGRKVPRADGTGSFTFGVVVDATERHAADEALRESEERQRRTIESVDAIVAIQEHAGAPIYCSPQLQSILGIDPATLTSFDAWRELVHPDDLERCQAVWSNRPATWELEYRMRHADGHFVWVLDRGRRIARDDGLGEGTFGFIVDVTDRHAAAEALRASEEQLRRIVEGVDVIISYQEAAGEAVVISPQTQRVLGYPPEAVAPFDAWEALIHPDDVEMCQEVWNGPGTGWDMNYRMRPAGGAWIWVNDRGRRITHDDGRGPGMFGVVTDITAQHEAAERQRASEARFRAMFEENPEAIGVLRPIFSSDGRFLDAEFVAANRTTRSRWLGGVPTELVAGTRASGLWFTAGEEVRDAVASVAETGLAARGEVHTTRDGVDAWSDLSVFPFEDGVAFVGRDITEQKRSELAVRDSEARFRAVTDSAGDAILTIDAAGVVVGWNPVAERMFGFPSGGLVDLPVTELMPAAAASAHTAAVQGRGDRAGGPIAGRLTQLEGRRTDGSTFPLEMSLAHWTLDGKRFDTAIIRDITERRNAEEAVREAAAFQRSVLDAIAEGMITVAPDLRITSANARAAAILGVDLPQLIGMSVGAAWEARRVDGTPFAIEDEPAMVTLRTGQSCRDVEMNVARPDGSRAWLRINSEPLRDREGAVFAAVATFTDITAERELGEQLRRSQRMEAVGQLAGGVAHDFNNLLAAIRGYSELALGTLPSGAEARADVEEVIRAADRGAALTRQLLLFGRRQVLTPRQVDPAEVVDGLIPMLRQLVGEHIELVATHDGRRAVVMADPGQLEQVILNLVVNARDAMPGGGRIDVITRRVDPADRRATGPLPAWPALRITVADTGHGIDPAVLPHIFEPFYTTKEAGGGSGMGLATVYGIVGASGGTVSVTTSPGRGTTFTIDLPVVDGAVAPAATADAVEEPTMTAGTVATRGTVLLVEDDAAVRAILARQLAGLGWRVVERASGTSAASALAAGELARPDLLVSDVRMPGIQGPDLARQLRASWPDLPVLFITGLADEVGADPSEPWMRVLTKPFDVERLGQALEAALEDRA